MGRDASPFDDVSTLAIPRVEKPSLVTPSFTLSVVEGPDRGNVVTLGEERYQARLGQSPACELRLTDPSVSRRHAAFELIEGGVRLRDLESKNGTFVNGVTIVEAILRGGETVRLGGTVITVNRAGTDVNIPLSDAASFGKVLGASRAMRLLYPLCARLAEADLPLLIEGETGTGKEVLAESIHEEGPRANGPFVVFDCTAVPANLIESALFGHEKGAFTGATEARSGVFEQADGGTLLIDEIGDLDVTLQAKLLRAVERSEIRRIGGKSWKRVNVRVLTATRRDLDRLVQEGHFRDDLFYRLSVTRLELPPLRRRDGDVALLVEYFSTTQGRDAAPFDAGAFLAHHEGYSWPGNVRELHNAVVRGIALGTSIASPGISLAGAATATFEAADSGQERASEIDRVLALDLPIARARQILVNEFEGRYVARVLERHGGNVGRAATASGIARRYFQILRARTPRS